MTGMDSRLGEVVDGRYEIDALVGQGGMGAVYRARHVVTGRRVAIKWLLENDPERRARFMREARAMARVKHPNVVDILDVGDHDGAIYMVMDHLTGRPLRDFIREGGMPAEEAIALLMPALAGVEAAHRAGILHRDVKPSNLFVCCERDGTPFDTKVLDFGVALIEQSDETLTRSGAVVGTPKYMAPEQVREEDLDVRTDLLALGTILYELLVGALPYESQKISALLLEILEPIPSVREKKPEIAAELAEVVDRAVARAPNDRYESVAAFARALEPFAGKGVRFVPPRDVHRASLPVGPLMDVTPKSGKVDAPELPTATTLAATPSRRIASRSSTTLDSSDPDDATAPARGMWKWWAAAALLLGVVTLTVAMTADGEPEPPVVEAPAAPGDPEPTEPGEEARPEPIVVNVDPAGAPEAEGSTTPADEDAAAQAAPPHDPVSNRRRPPAAPPMTPASMEAGNLEVEGRSGVLRAEDF